MGTTHANRRLVQRRVSGSGLCGGSLDGAVLVDESQLGGGHQLFHPVVEVSRIPENVLGSRSTSPSTWEGFCTSGSSPGTKHVAAWAGAAGSGVAVAQAISTIAALEMACSIRPALRHGGAVRFGCVPRCDLCRTSSGGRRVAHRRRLDRVPHVLSSLSTTTLSVHHPRSSREHPSISRTLNHT